MSGNSTTSSQPRLAGTSSATSLKQQSLLREFGRFAMQTRDFQKILQRAIELCASGLQAPFAKVLEYEPDEKRLMVRAGVGWAQGTIDIVSLAADVGSPAVTPIGRENPSFPTTSKRKPASARLSS